MGLMLLASVGIVSATQADSVVRDANFNGWSYVAGHTPEGTLVATVKYDHSSAAALRAYAALNRTLLSRASGGPVQVEAQLTFARPVPASDFRALVSTLSLTVQVSEVRTANQQGQRSTVAVFAQSGSPLPQAALDQMVASASRRVGPLTVTGVTSARVMVPAGRLAALVADPRVFLVDMTPTLVRQDLRVAQVADADQAKIVDGSPFWFMEDFGLGNF